MKRRLYPFLAIIVVLALATDERCRAADFAYITDMENGTVSAVNVSERKETAIFTLTIKGKNAEAQNKDLLMSIIAIKEIMSDLDRIADHATNIAEAAIYAMEGKDVRHHNIQKS